MRGPEYYELHKWRFLEMINALGFLKTCADLVELLEIGTIFSTKLIHEFFPDIRISTLDRYEEHQIGYEDVYWIRDTATAHYNVDLLSDDIDNLASGGGLYMTTPTAADRHKMRHFLDRDFPFQPYPLHFKTVDAHMHHVREYGLSELLEACAQEGFAIEAFCFSACWDKDKQASSFDDDRLGNLVVLARKP